MTSSDPGETLYTLDYYLKLAEQIVDAGAHVLAIKDMAGLLRPQAAATLVGALRSRFDLPVHVHTHDTPGGQLATYLAAWQAGASAVDGAAAPLAGTTSQPALSSIVAAAAHTEYDTGLSLTSVCELEPYWEALRKVYAPFDVAASGPPFPTGRVYHHEIPGGQLSNLRQQAIALGLGDRFEEIEESYAGADRILGRLVKVTPSSKVVGDLALALVGAGVSADEFAADPARFDIPDSVIEFFRGELGDPPGGWPEPLRTKALAGRPPAKPTRELTPDDEAALALAGPKRQAELNRLLFPGPTKEFDAHRDLYGDTSSLSANQFFYGLRHGDEHRVTLERGVELLIGLEAVSEPDERGMRTVMCILNGQLRPVVVRDRSIASEVPAAEKADRSNPDHVAAPFAGVVTVAVASGDKVERRTDDRHHRSDEDGGRDHRSQGGHRRPDRRLADRTGRRWGPPGGGQLTRIVAGSLGGRRIAVPQGRLVRAPARPPTGCASRCSTCSPRGWTSAARPSSTCTPAPERSGSRRCRAVRPLRCSSSPISALRR